MKSQFQNWTQSEPVDGRTLTKRWPADDRRIHCRPPAIDRSPNGHRWASWRSSAGHRRGIGRKFGHFQWKSTGGRTVSRRRLTLRHGSRSRKSGSELPISKNRHPAKIYRSPRNLCFLGRRLNKDIDIHFSSVKIQGRRNCSWTLLIYTITVCYFVWMLWTARHPNLQSEAIMLTECPYFKSPPDNCSIW